MSIFNQSMSFSTNIEYFIVDIIDIYIDYHKYSILIFILMFILLNIYGFSTNPLRDQRSPPSDAESSRESKNQLLRQAQTSDPPGTARGEVL